MNRIAIGLAGLIAATSLPGPAWAWMHANRWGGDTFHAFGSDSVTRTDGWGGSMTHTFGEGTTATDRWGGSATHTYGEGTTWHGADGGTVHTDAYWGGAYHPYYPAPVVDSYRRACLFCAAGAVAAGAAVGAAVGTASAEAAAASTAYAVGTTLTDLPSGCVLVGGGTTFYQCGSAWIKPVFGANGVYYKVVPAP
jgi:hypothetical protein